MLTEDQMDHIWHDRGLKYRMSSLHKKLLDFGLLPLAINEEVFLDHMRRELNEFFVKGLCVDQNGRQTYSDK